MQATRSETKASLRPLSNGDSTNGASIHGSYDPVPAAAGPDHPTSAALPDPDHRSVLPRRSRLELRMDILRAIRRGANKPTQIMYRANMSWNALGAHLGMLESRSLIAWSTVGSRRQYVLTNKGEQVISSYLRLLEDTGIGSTGAFFPF